jgi:ADP-ribosylglycohydrolase
MDLIVRIYGEYRECPLRYPAALAKEAPELRSRLRPLGLHSDDTQQALALLHACLVPGGWQVGQWVSQLVKGEKQKAWRGTGRNFRDAVKNMRQGKPPLECGIASAGLGAAMRVGPIGAWYAEDEAALERVVRESALTTHADPRAVAMAFAVATGCSMLARGTSPDQVRARLPQQVEGFESALRADVPFAPHSEEHWHGVSDTLNRFLTKEWHDKLKLRAAMADLAVRNGLASSSASSFANHPFVLLGGVHALCVALLPDVAPGELLARVVQEGGDADTVGAITGALLGARFGAGWVPLSRLLDADMLYRYSLAPCNGPLPESFDAFLEREAQLSQLERRYRPEFEDME